MSVLKISSCFLRRGRLNFPKTKRRAALFDQTKAKFSPLLVFPYIFLFLNIWFVYLVNKNLWLINISFVCVWARVGGIKASRARGPDDKPTCVHACVLLACVIRCYFTETFLLFTYSTKYLCAWFSLLFFFFLTLKFYEYLFVWTFIFLSHLISRKIFICNFSHF